ncbi:MAG TPA: hypothetical protein VIY86_00945, partial [Pirellulaceae bacterium]
PGQNAPANSSRERHGSRGAMADARRAQILERQHLARTQFDEADELPGPQPADLFPQGAETPPSPLPDPLDSQGELTDLFDDDEASAPKPLDPAADSIPSTPQRSEVPRSGGAELDDDSDFNDPFESDPLEPSPSTPRETMDSQEDGHRSDSDDLWEKNAEEALDVEDSSDSDELMRELQEIEDEGKKKDKTPPCDRTYNDRNCCLLDEKCDELRTKFEQEFLRNISLDITPPFAPITKDPVKARKLRDDRLAKSAARTWMDLQGRVLATGRLVDLRHGCAIVRGENGVEVPIKVGLLGRDERCFVTAWWNLPFECPADHPLYEVRDFTCSTMTWNASALCHKPLYFEEVQLERYGHAVCPTAQPFLSGAHFFSSLVLLPYNMGLYPPCECKYALGYYRPGSCAPWMVPAFPLSRRALFTQASAIAGLYAIPH